LYVSKEEPTNSTPYNSQTVEHRTTKIGRCNIGPNLTPFAKVGSSQPMGGGAAKPSFMSTPVFYFCFFPAFFDRATDRTQQPTSMVDDSKDVVSHGEVPFGGHVIT
jgi:hypothetical protein